MILVNREVTFALAGIYEIADSTLHQLADGVLDKLAAV